MTLLSNLNATQFRDQPLLTVRMAAKAAFNWTLKAVKAIRQHLGDQKDYGALEQMSTTQLADMGIRPDQVRHAAAQPFVGVRCCSAQTWLV